MAVMTGYFDDSRTDGRVLTVAGLVCRVEQWEQFELSWADLLERHKVSYLHMKEMMEPNGPFAKWLPPDKHREEVKGFFSDVAAAINNSGLESFSSIVRIRDLNKFNKDHRLRLEAYSLAVYGCMAQIYSLYPQTLVSLIFDHIEKVYSRLERAVKYARGDITFPAMADYVIPTPLPPRCSFREVCPLQAADFIAWETRKHHLKQEDWWTLNSLPHEWSERFAHFKNWSKEKFGTSLPPPRKSIEAVAKNFRVRGGPMFDYRGLSIAHNARNGVW